MTPLLAAAQRDNSLIALSLSLLPHLSRRRRRRRIVTAIAFGIREQNDRAGRR